MGLSERPVVFIGPYEHHSNELLRESLAEVRVIPETPDGHIDLNALEDALKETQDRPMRIGSFSAASNVTGIGSKTAEISSLLHKYNALSFWDFAAGPYVRIEMNAQEKRPEIKDAYKDAIFISPHKFIGGGLGLRVFWSSNVSSSSRRFLHFQAVAPSRMSQKKLKPITVIPFTEKSGTPAIIESIRAGLVFQLKEAPLVGTSSETERGLHPTGYLAMVEAPKYSHLRK